jgi:hypothetical protein
MNMAQLSADIEQPLSEAQMSMPQCKHFMEKTTIINDQENILGWSF